MNWTSIFSIVIVFFLPWKFIHIIILSRRIAANVDKQTHEAFEYAADAKNPYIRIFHIAVKLVFPVPPTSTAGLVTVKLIQHPSSVPS
jgi:hypothetical protein